MSISPAFTEVLLRQSLDQAAAHMRDILQISALGITVADERTTQDWQTQWHGHTAFGNWAFSALNTQRKVVHLALYSGPALCGLCEMSGGDKPTIRVVEGAPHTTLLSGHVAGSFVSALSSYAELTEAKTITIYKTMNGRLSQILETLGFTDDPDGLIYPFDMCFTSSSQTPSLNWSAYLNDIADRHKNRPAAAPAPGQAVFHGPTW